MYKELKTLLYDGENHYLQKAELDNLSLHLNSLEARLATYKKIRDQELNIFEIVGDSVEQIFPKENPVVLAKALKNWIAILRYCSMAMLLNSSEFLQRRLLEWLAPVLKAQETEVLESKIYQLLIARLKQLLTPEEIILILPYLEEAQGTLLSKLVNL